MIKDYDYDGTMYAKAVIYGMPLRFFTPQKVTIGYPLETEITVPFSGERASKLHCLAINSMRGAGMLSNIRFSVGYATDLKPRFIIEAELLDEETARMAFLFYIENFVSEVALDGSCRADVGIGERRYLIDGRPE